MRTALAFVTLSAAVLSTEAAAFSLELPPLRAPILDLDTVVSELAPFQAEVASRSPDGDAPSGLFFGTPPLVVPPRYGWVLDDGRPFWYAAGASAVVALGTHVLVGLPVTVIASMAISPFITLAPAATLPVLFGIGGVYLLAQSALAAGAATLAFGATSDLYDGNYLAGLAAHVGGALLGAGVSGLTFGIGGLLFGGLNMIAEFTGSAGLSGIGVFSLLGALPAVVIGGIALVGVPAVLGAWALAAGATAKEGYAIDPHWRSPTPPPAPAVPVTPVARGDAAALPVASLALPTP
ncbi:MAG: hypothetical protein HYS27_16335 [Deltaproteobacteria bacterium]|nr:hypothetical protein [Deltaproteobacteria bacterium]